MADETKSKTKLLDDLEKGPWPSFVTEIKKATATNPMCATMRFYKQHSVIKNGARTHDVDINLQGDIIVGKFVDIERPTLRQTIDQQLRQTLKDQYTGWALGEA